MGQHNISRQTQLQNSYSNYFKHKEEFYKKIREIEAQYPYIKFKNPDATYNELFPNAKPCNFGVGTSASTIGIAVIKDGQWTLPTLVSKTMKKSGNINKQDVKAICKNLKVNINNLKIDYNPPLVGPSFEFASQMINAETWGFHGSGQICLSDILCVLRELGYFTDTYFSLGYNFIENDSYKSFQDGFSKIFTELNTEAKKQEEKQSAYNF